jgi:hypothetical protein
MVHVFSKFVAPIIAFARKNGHEASAYLDDLHTLARTEEKCLLGISFIRSVMREAGIVEAENKYQPPTQRGRFLGLINNLESWRYEIPEDKVAKIKQALRDLCAKDTAPTRKVASAYGQLAACRLACGPTLRLLTRVGQKYYAKDGANDWDGYTNLKPFRREMKVLIDRLDEINGFHIFGKEAPVAINTVVASDASGVGFGLVRVHCGEQKDHMPHEGPCSTFLAKKLFSLDERKTSSALREILALREAYAKDCLGLRDISVLHLTDSSSVEAVM